MGVSREILRKKTSDIPLICTMKTFAVILACLVATIRADITCEDCLVFGGAMSDYLQSEASLAEQTAILAAALCPGESDPAGCEEALNTYLSPRSSRVMPRLLTLLPSFREISVILLERKIVLKVWLILCPRPCPCLPVCWPRRLESTAAPCPPAESAARSSLFTIPSRLKRPTILSRSST